MSAFTNGNEINALAALTRSAPTGVVSAIKQASTRTGVDFAYLVQQAKAESSFDPDAKAKTSSATGLYQFIDSTWLGMVRDHGEKYGLGNFSKAIDARGQVTDPALKSEILELRKDPSTASLLAAEFAAQNKQFLERNWGGEVGATELYFAHFMGAGGAAGFLKARDEDPLADGADLFPREARANRGVFYDPSTGKPRSLAEIYNFFDKKFAVEGNAPVAMAKASRPRTSAMPADYLRTTARPEQNETVEHYLHIMSSASRMQPSPLEATHDALTRMRFLTGQMLLAPHDIYFLGDLKSS